HFGNLGGVAVIGVEEFAKGGFDTAKRGESRAIPHAIDDLRVGAGRNGRGLGKQTHLGVLSAKVLGKFKFLWLWPMNEEVSDRHDGGLRCKWICCAPNYYYIVASGPRGPRKHRQFCRGWIPAGSWTGHLAF